MRISCATRVCFWGLGAAALIGTAGAAPPADQDFFLRRWQAYENLAKVGYERYPLFPQPRPLFDRVGNFVTYGTMLVRWDENRDRYIEDKLKAGADILDTQAQSVIFEDPTAMNSFGSLSMSHQGWNGRGASFFVGENLTTSFTPLVFCQTNFSGARLDFSTPSHELTFLLSRGGVLGRGVFSDFNGDPSGIVSMSPVLLYGANWRGKFGVFDLGAAFVRQVQSNIKGDRQSLYRGDVPYPEMRQPKRITVRITDDSPRDQLGAAVYDVHVFVKERKSGKTYTSSPQAAGPEVVFIPGLQPQVKGRSVGGHWVAQGGEEVVDFEFTVPPEFSAESVEIAARVAGDYRIGVRQAHDFLNPKTGAVEERSWPSTPTPFRFNLDFKDKPYTLEPFYTVVRARGNPRPDPSPKVVRFNYSIPTGQSFYSLNGRINAEELAVEAELAANPQDFIFPVQDGDRERKHSYAGFLRLRRNLGRVGSIGGEVFRLDPTYGGWYDSRRGGAIFFTDVAGDALGGEDKATDALTQEFPLYDDNDDHDVWPDDSPQAIDYPYVPKGAFKEVDALGSRPESGVYPGLDMDGDHVYDMDKNRNGIGDWLEPFFDFDADPPEFVYDVDFNNNGVPDSRENDDEPDYPYRRGQRGLHLLFNVARRPSWLDRTVVGWYRILDSAGGGKATAIYGRTAAHIGTPEFSLTLADDVKRVKDDIPDDVYPFFLTTDTKLFLRFNTSAYVPPPDPLLMRNSVVNTLFLKTRYALCHSLEFTNNFRCLVNRRHQQRDPQGDLSQDARTLNNFTMVNKVEYTLQPLAALTVWARAKHLLMWADEGSYNFKYVVNTPADTLQQNPKASWSMFTPSVKAQYRLTPNTSLECGQSGFFTPALRARYRDRTNPAGSYTDNLSILQLTMTGVHQGYEVKANLGVRWEITHYDSRAKRPEERFSAFFLDMVFGAQ